MDMIVSTVMIVQTVTELQKKKFTKKDMPHSPLLCHVQKTVVNR